jgi:hypothetical protein
MPRHPARIGALCSIAVAAALSGCHPYNQTYYTPATRDRYVEAGIHSPIVEFDDDGYMRAPWQLDSALAAMDDATGGGPGNRHPVVVVVFIHGWHNNASLDNENLQEFNRFASSLETRLQSDSSTSKTTVLPIYLAWRGQNTWNPHWYNTYIIPFAAQYLTFFSRKATAERIGRGGLETALARISRKWHEWRINPSSTLRKNFLVIAGHSFGGAALLTATLPQFVAEQEAVRARRARPNNADTATAIAESAQAPADLLIAVNPAIEASMLDRTVLTDGAPFARDGALPQLLVLDADNDGARGFWFKVGQTLGNLGHVHTPHSEAERLAVAKLPGQVKFSLGRTTPTLTGDEHACTTIPTQRDSLHLVALDDRPCINSVMVVQTHQKIIDGHSGIWGDENREFLIQFVARQHQRVLTTLR